MSVSKPTVLLEHYLKQLKLPTVNVGEKVRRVAERKCDTVTRLKPAEWRVSIPLLSFACGSPSFQTVF